MKEKFIGVIILGIIFQSCVTNKYLSSATPTNEVTNIEYFEPYSYIQLIKKGNKSELNDSLSLESKRIIDSVIYSNKNLYKIKNKIIIENSSINEKVENEFSFLIQSAMQKRKLEGIKLTPVIDSILESRNQRFAIGIVATGFGRRKGNYGGQVAKGVVVGVLTLGLFSPIPIKSNLSLYSIIVDSEKNEIAFYKKTLPIEKSPTDPNIIKKQLDKIYENYLFKKK
jgi:hypothetical protein|tara:strand:+ start:156 stop:833 length:678 start_codon:yes stop_codon:yes gene_type:complete